MNSNGNRAKAILHADGDGLQALGDCASAPASGTLAAGGHSASNVLPFSGRERPRLKARRAQPSTYSIEKEEIQDAMDCLIRLRAIITLRESEFVDP